MLERFDLTKRMHDGRRIIAELENLGAVAVPSHPFRESVFGSVIERNFTEVAGIRILERYNGQNNDKQNERADALCAQHALRGLGGSDAHYVHPAWFLTCATAFDDTITSSDELVGGPALRALSSGDVAGGRGYHLPCRGPWSVEPFL